MEDIALESAKLIAIDQVSELVINQLRSEGVYSLDNSPYVLMNMLLVSSQSGINNIKSILACQKKVKRTVVVLIDPELQVQEDLGIDSVVSFSNKDAFYNEFKNFLSLIRHNVEIHGLISFDFNDFFSMIKGRCVLSIRTCGYTENISEALTELQHMLFPKDAYFLLSFTVEQYNPKTIEKDLELISNFMDCFPEESSVYWNFNEMPSKEVTLFISKQV
jgi:hypothetical protein